MKLQNSALRYFPVSLLFILSISCGAPKESTSTASRNFIAPGYVKKNYNKVLVLAHVDPDIFRKRIERNVIEELRARRINAEGSTEFITPALMADSVALKQEILKRGFDAAIVLTYLGNMTGVSDSYMENGNIYNIFTGAYPVFDLETRSTKNHFFQADFFTLEGKGTQWRSSLMAKGGQDPDMALRDMGNQLRRKLQDDKIL